MKQNLDDLDSAEFFKPLLEVARVSTNAERVGLVMVPQEGENGAGRISSVITSEADFIDEETAKSFFECKLFSLPMDDHIRQEFDRRYTFLELSGQFSTPIGYLWWPKAIPNQAIFKYVANFCLSHIENSKKARFHNVFMEAVGRETHDQDDTFNKSLLIVADAIRQGIYCDKTVVWRKHKKTLRAINENGLDLFQTDSLVGMAYETGLKVVKDFRLLPKHQIKHWHWINKHELNSAFFFSLDGDNYDGRIEAVVGVFYHRPNGTTKIDQELCSYAISYFHKIWQLETALTSAKVELERVGTYGTRGLEMVSALVDFHRLTNISLSFSTGIDQLKIVKDSYTGPSVLMKQFNSQLSILEASARELRATIDSNSIALRAAGESFINALVHVDHPTEKFDLYKMVSQEIDKVTAEVIASRAKIHLDFNLSSRNVTAARYDLKEVIVNLISNAVRALGNRKFGGGSVHVEVSHYDNEHIVISVSDNAGGIDPEIINKIWDLDFTTHKEGKGIGLYVVKSIANKYGFDPEVTNDWGKFVKFSVIVRGKI